MSNINKWAKKMDEYYEKVSRDQLLRDSRKAGIVLRPVDQNVKYVIGSPSKSVTGRGRRITARMVKQLNPTR